ncbi:WD repeat domain 21 [Stigmatopora nigra]
MMMSWNWIGGQRSQRGQQNRGRRPFRGRHWRQPRHDRNWYDGPGSSSRMSDSQASTSSSSNSSDAPELPGFYFDSEKNRYFRLLPGHNNCNPLTREKLRNMEREKERTRRLAEDENPTKKAPRPGLNATMVLQNHHLGLLRETSYCRRVHEGKISIMRRHKLDLQIREDLRTLVADSNCEQALTVHDMPNGGSKYGYMSFGRNNSSGSPSVKMCEYPHITERKVNCLCWATVTHPNSHVLLCMLGTAKNPGLLNLVPTSLFSYNSQPSLRITLKISTAWCCAWSRHPSHDKLFSVGLSHKIILHQAVTGNKTIIDVASDVLAQQFGANIPLLYNGCRSGAIFGFDVRNPGQGKAVTFKHQYPITSLQILQDENYLVAADMSGRINLWDIRAIKHVQEYKGHYNEHAYLPIHVREPEGLLLAVGQDCYTRIWSLRDSRLLRTIPSPHPVANDAIPSIIFSSGIGGREGTPGLVMALKKDFYYFPYNADEREQREA